TDPTGRNFYRQDPRPEEFRQPEYDTLRRGPSDYYRTGRETLSPSVIPLEQIPEPTPQFYQPGSRSLERIPAPSPERESARSHVSKGGPIRQVGFERPDRTLANGETPAPKRASLDDRLSRH
ncbi:MAG: hypothetical protein ACI8P0_004515, partial [Planctomycetaceae bacterium]